MIVGDYNILKDVDFSEGVTLLVDKPLGWTSFDVVNKIRFRLRRITGRKKIKVGHSGTLDPLATGLLIISAGKDTSLLSSFQNLDKEYIGTMFIGATTPSFDSEFEPDRYFPTDHIDQILIENARKNLTGTIMKAPPIYSAIKTDGKKAYEKARSGQEFKLKEREIVIYDFQLSRIDLPEIEFFVRCQKGTYIRSLVNDFGLSLKSGAYLKSLKRLKIGEYDLQNAFNLDELIFFLENLD
jgi:tRNA pseudouridine55 synthase